MFSKIALLALLAASVSASGGFSSFSYGVSDPNTGDIKDQHEKRVGGNVVGKYSLLESDGTKRVVEYSADDATGFKAVVHKEPAGVGAGAIGGTLAHGGALAHPGALAPLAHAAPLAGAHANPWSAGVAPGPLGAAGPLAHGAHGALANPLAYGNAGLYGQAGLNGGYGNPLAGPNGQAGHGAPTVSSYSHRIVHNGPGAFPYGGAYGRYGAYGNGGYGTHGALAGANLPGSPLSGAHLAGAPFGGATLAHANPWAASAAQANPWAANAAQANPWSASAAQANPWANGAALAHGGLASPLGAYGAHGLEYGSQSGW